MSWPPALTLALAVPLAWAIDARFGEPRDAWHPVAWLGRALAPVGLWLRALSPAPAFIGGAAVWLIGAGAIAWLASALQAALTVSGASPWVAVPLLALLLKPTFAWRMLRDEATAVEAALSDEGVDAARARLARLVSRDVRVLDAALIRETTIETIAENLNDSVVAPLFWYALFGLPGAAVYRFANTLDAMWGYRGAWEWAGKWSARADDVLSWLPARLTALWLLPTPRLFEQARQTPSPNSGWPMGAMALRLGVRLRKPGVYALNGDAPSPNAEQVRLALAYAGRVAGISVVLVVVAWMARLP
jgi:adenosylcobinamide-phosphate synthase